MLVGVLRDWQIKPSGQVQCVPRDEFLDGVFLGHDSVIDKEGDQKAKKLLESMLLEFRAANPGKKWPSTKVYEKMVTTSESQAAGEKSTRKGRTVRDRVGIVF